MWAILCDTVPHSDLSDTTTGFSQIFNAFPSLFFFFFLKEISSYFFYFSLVNFYFILFFEIFHLCFQKKNNLLHNERYNRN